MILVSDAILYARQLSQTDSNGLTDTLGLTFASDAQRTFIRDLSVHNIDAVQTQESYTDLVGGQGSYAWPSDLFSLKTIELDYTGGGGTNYIQPNQVDVSNIQGETSFSALRLNQSTADPLIDNRGDTYEIFPTPLTTISQGIRLFYFLNPTDYVAISDALSYPITLDYRCLGEKIAALYAKRLQQYDVEADFNKSYEKRRDDIILILAPGTQQPIQPTPIELSGWEF